MTEIAKREDTRIFGSANLMRQAGGGYLRRDVACRVNYVEPFRSVGFGCRAHQEVPLVIGCRLGCEDLADFVPPEETW